VAAGELEAAGRPQRALDVPNEGDRHERVAVPQMNSASGDSSASRVQKPRSAGGSSR
jgi:hypothetical protein